MREPTELLVDVGVPADVAAAYASLVERPEDQPPADLVPALRDRGLVRVDLDGQVHPLPPRWAVGALVRGRREELMAADDRLTATVVAAEDLQAQYERAQERRGEAPLIEVLYGDRAADATVEQLATGMTRSLMALQPGPTTGRHEPRQADLQSLARGVESRCIYSPGYLAEEGAVAVVQVLRAAGEQARVHARLPAPMLIFDEEVVVLPTDRSGHPSKGAAIIRSSSVIHMCVTLFELLWQEATSFLDVPADRARAGADPIPDLLLAGLNDDRIARELDVSVRTVRRRIRELMDRHGVASRVQLGAALVRQHPSDAASPDGPGQPGGPTPG